MGFEPTTLCDLVGCSTTESYWATGDSMVSKGQFMGLDWNRITRLHSQVMAGTQDRAVTLKHIKMQLTNIQSEYIKDLTTTGTRIFPSSPYL